MDAATGKLVATKEESGNVNLSESETGSREETVTVRPVAYNPAAGREEEGETLCIQSNQTARDVQKLKR